MLANTLLSVPVIASSVQRMGSQVDSISTRMNAIDAQVEVLSAASSNVVPQMPVVREFKVSSSGFNYVVEGLSGNVPSLYVLNGFTYAFALDIGSTHPLIIRDSLGNAVVDGMKHVAADGTETLGSSANTGRTSGTLYWTVPYEVSGDYKYQCVNHSGMIGNVVVKNITAL